MPKPLIQYTEEWHEARRLYVGASEVADICGFGPRNTAQDVYDTKHDGIPDNRESDVNTPAWWGTVTEPLIVKAALSELHPRATDTQVHTKLAWVDVENGLLASPDAVFTPEPILFARDQQVPHELIEAKWVGASKARDWKDGPPKYVQLQVHAQMAVMGDLCQCAHIAAMICGAPVQIWTIDRSRPVCEAIKTICHQFWEQFHEMGANSWEQFVNYHLMQCMFLDAKPEYNPKTQTLTADDLPRVLAWAWARDEYKQAESRKKGYDSEIEELLGEADTLLSPGGEVLVRRNWVTRSSFDRKALATDHPELEEKYTYDLRFSRITTSKELNNYRF